MRWEAAIKNAKDNPEIAWPEEAKPKTQAHKRSGGRMWKTEREFQSAVFKAAKWEALRQPAFNLLFHVPNENSHKTPGVKGGVPDLFLAVPIAGYGGLFIELKVGDNKPSQRQLETISDLRAAGYVCHVIWDSLDDVMFAILAYLDMGK